MEPASRPPLQARAWRGLEPTRHRHPASFPRGPFPGLSVPLLGGPNDLAQVAWCTEELLQGNKSLLPAWASGVRTAALPGVWLAAPPPPPAVRQERRAVCCVPAWGVRDPACVQLCTCRPLCVCVSVCGDLCGGMGKGGVDGMGLWQGPQERMVGARVTSFAG